MHFTLLAENVMGKAQSQSSRVIASGTGPNVLVFFGQCQHGALSVPLQNFIASKKDLVV